MFQVFAMAVSLVATQSALPPPEPHDFVVRDFRFASGETLPEVRIHYRTIGRPIRDARGRITNGVLVLHGSSGDAGQVLAASFSEPLFGAGGPVDAARHYLIFPDNLGNGRSTKPSDGLRGASMCGGSSRHRAADDTDQNGHRLNTNSTQIRSARSRWTRWARE